MYDTCISLQLRMLRYRAQAKDSAMTLKCNKIRKIEKVMLSCWQQSLINDPYGVAVSTYSIYDLGI